MVFKMINIGLIEIEIMPWSQWFTKGGLNFQGVDIFDAIQIWRIEIRKYKSKEAYQLWKKT